ncbi:MAG: threonine--tRNA ligase [Gammaproteobacteria bacterium]|nr:threonine--tRNA ligase [Gammaproteobacteria bacterium]
MPTISLPDKRQLSFENPVTVETVVADIGAGLAKAALAAKVNDILVDLSHVIEKDATLKVITAKDPEGVDILRHSTAHLLAQAVKALFPSAQVTIGPVIEDGFYYDFAFERSFTPEDLAAIESKIHELAAKNYVVRRTVMGRDEAIAFFRNLGEEYKAQIIEDIPTTETLSLYQQGDFVDLCRGPHVPNTRHLKAFKLMKLAGAYWRGDSNNAMLQRIYGTAWADEKALAAYLYRLEEAEKRDHRKLGKLLDLFHTQEEAPGMVFWHAKGWQLYRTIESYIRDKLNQYDYQEVRTPQIVDKILWEKSGHWAQYREEMWVTSTENRDYAIKPMNCPLHVQIFKQGIHSYRDLPLRLAEFGSCHRNEPSGTLHGLMRVRNFTQDDAHLFIREDQIESEATKLLDLVYEVYHDFGFDDISCKLSTRPEKRIGDDTIWDKAEEALKRVLDKKGVEWTLQPGDGAFYGPKIDFKLRDCLGREWQCGTVQLDRQTPERLDASYIDEAGNKVRPIMLHRAILGSMERFVGVLIEHFAAKFPVWLAPVQAVILTVTDNQNEYAQKVYEILKKQGVRVEKDLRNEKIGFKIREHTLQKVPYLLIIGDKEVSSSQITLRSRAGEDLGAMSLADFTSLLQQEMALLGRGKSG